MLKSSIFSSLVCNIYIYLFNFLVINSLEGGRFLTSDKSTHKQFNADSEFRKRREVSNSAIS